MKSELETQEEEKQSQVKSEQEAREEEKQSQVESEQEVQKEKRREDEGRGEEGKTGEEEEREKEVEAQEEQRREVRREERGSEERDVEPQQGGEERVDAQGRQGEEGDRVDAQGGRGRKEGETSDENSLHEESHASNRHMTWWRNAWWVRVNNGPHMRTARGRRRIWRAARQAAEQACHEEWVGETQRGEGEREERGARKERQQQQEQQRQQPVAIEIVFQPEHDPKLRLNLLPVRRVGGRNAKQAWLAAPRRAHHGCAGSSDYGGNCRSTQNRLSGADF